MERNYGGLARLVLRADYLEKDSVKNTRKGFQQ